MVSISIKVPGTKARESKKDKQKRLQRNALAKAWYWAKKGLPPPAVPMVLPVRPPDYDYEGPIVRRSKSNPAIKLIPTPVVVPPVKPTKTPKIRVPQGGWFRCKNNPADRPGPKSDQWRGNVIPKGGACAPSRHGYRTVPGSFVRTNKCPRSGWKNT